MKYGCTHFMTVYGLSCILGSALGIMDARQNAHQVIAGGMAGSAGLITYNCFANPHFLRFRYAYPLLVLSALTYYAATSGDKAAVGGISAGYLAFLLAL